MTELRKVFLLIIIIYNTNTPTEFQITEVYDTNNKKWNIVYNPCLSLEESPKCYHGKKKILCYVVI